MDRFVQWDKLVFRGSRPENADDLRMLWGKGIRTIISLEEGFGTFFGWWNREAIIWRGMGGTWLQVKLSSVIAPTEGQLAATLSLIMAYSKDSAMFVHCGAGCDRTGMVMADYRVHAQGHTAAEAWAEAGEQGMHKRYQWLWQKSFFKVEGK